MNEYHILWKNLYEMTTFRIPLKATEQEISKNEEEKKEIMEYKRPRQRTRSQWSIRDQGSFRKEAVNMSHMDVRRKKKIKHCKYKHIYSILYLRINIFKTSCGNFLKLEVILSQFKSKCEWSTFSLRLGEQGHMIKQLNIVK